MNSEMKALFERFKKEVLVNLPNEDAKEAFVKAFVLGLARL